MTEEATTQPGPAIEAICARHVGREGPLLPILHDVQMSRGFVSEQDVRAIADYLNLSRAEVHGVVSFYHDFRRSRPATHRLKICRAEACQAVGGRAVWAAAEQAVDTSDSAVDIEAVYCLGNCPCAPSAQLNGRAVGRLTPVSVRRLIESTAAGL